MEGIISELAFDEGIAMPIANEENKKLEMQLEQKQKDITRMHAEVDQYGDRIRAMSDHLKNVRQERQQTQELCNARDREIETEEHFRQLAEREEGRLTSEIKRLEKELEVLNERKNIYENNIFKGTERLEQMKGQMNWDQQALDAWLKESAKRDEDTLILQKYGRVDDGKIKELSLRQEKMIDECAKKRRALEHEITQTLTSQLELDKVSEAFREAHKARQELLEQWESTIVQMQKRDAEMDEASLQLMELRMEANKRQEGLKEQQQFLDNELNNNNEKEKKISAAERIAAKLRLQYQNVENARLQFEDELETLKYTVDRTAKDLDNSRKQVAELKKEVSKREEKLIQAKETNEELQQQYKLAQNTKLTSEERAQLMEAALKKEDARIHQIEKELTKLRETQFKKTQELYQVRQMESNTTAEIQGGKASSRNLSSKLYKLDQESLKQQEIVYNQDFQLQQLERKMARLQGERSSEEKTHLQEKIKQFSEILEGQQLKHGALTTQLKKLSDDLRRANRDLTKGSSEKKDIASKIGELSLHNDSSERELKDTTSRKQDLMVEENILKLEIKRLRDQLHDRANDVLSLEERRLLLDTAMKERRQEVNIHNDMLKAQVKCSEEERQKISAELHERISKIEKLRKRYEILMVSMAPPEGEEEHSQAYYVIKAAQEKEELQRTGDDLDAKIRKAEKEIRALENTLRLMNGRNETYRKSFASVEETSEEYEEKLQLEEQLRAVMDKYKYKRRQIKELQEDLQTMQTTSEALSLDENELINAMEEKQRTMESLQKDLDGQEEKKDRASRTISKLTREIRSANKTKSKLPDEEDIELREMRDFNKKIIKDIGAVAHTHPDILPIVNLYFNQAGLPTPPSPGSVSSRPSSMGSARSSLLSSRSSSTVRSNASVRSSLNNKQVIAATSLDIGLDAFSSHTPAGTPPRSAATSRAGSAGKATPTRTSGGKTRSAQTPGTSPTKPPSGRSSASGMRK